MLERGTKFYRKNEKEVMQQLGFNPTINSGAGWISKEDGENDIALCQLKSTDKMSMSIKSDDLRTLEMNALVSHKLPVFAVQFLQTGEIWLMLRPSDVEKYAEYVRTGSPDMSNDFLDSLEEQKENTEKTQKSVDRRNDKSYNSSVNKKAREKYYEKVRKEKEEKKVEWKRNSSRKALQLSKDLQ